jgi:hypothetical protein
MPDIEIRGYRGDFEDIAELVRRVWIPDYAGKKVWFPLPDASFFRWHLEAASDARCVVAYEGKKLVGSVSCMPHSLRIGSSVVPVALHTSFTVDPAHRRIALPLIERLRREHEDAGIALAIGLILDDPTSSSYQFWTKYAQTFPRKFRVLLRGGYWAKFLAPRIMARAGVNGWERQASRALGPLLAFTPHRHDPHVRSYRAGDLERCVEILNKTSAALDWALAWSPKELSHLVDNPESATLVFERDGQIHGMVNYLSLMLQGREPIRAALIDVWADDGLSTAERVRMLGHLCNHMRERDIHGVVAARSAMMPAAALAANMFVPATDHFRIGVHLIRGEIPQAPPKTWSLLIR